ncbi:MAG: formyltransferase family protein, partial [Phototrophicaceae bacterium]
MHVVLLCATERGYRFLERLHQLLDPADHLTVCSFRETAWEPPYLDRIQARAQQIGATFYEARSVTELDWTEPMDMLFMVSWRYLVPHSFYGQARLGSFVFHDSLLPSYRGFSPTVWAIIINGEDHTGVSLFHASEAYDTGDIIAQQRVPIPPDASIGQVIEHVTEAYLDLLTRHFPTLRNGDIHAHPQDHRL